MLETSISSGKPSLLEEYINTKNNLEKYYDYVTEGMIIRSRVKWYEDGEKCTKYFLNLEKGNKIKSSVRKLEIRDKEITNPKTIMSEIKNYFVNKYKKTGQCHKDGMFQIS